MEVVSQAVRRYCRFLLKLNAHLFALFVLGWLGVFVAAEPGAVSSRAAESLYAVSAAFASFISLKLLGYFDPVRLLPRKSDLLLVAIVAPVGSIAGNAATLVVMNDEVLSLVTGMKWSPLITILVFASHYFFSFLKVHLGRKKKVVLDISQSERNSLVGDFADQEMDRHMVFLSRQELKEYLLRGAHEEIDLIVISRSTVSHFEEDPVLLRAHLAGIRIVDYRTVASALTGRIKLAESDLWSYVLGANPQTPLLRAFTGLKLVIEPLMAVFLAVLFSPVMIGLAAAIKLTSKGPIFYRQVRTGYLGRNFTLIKFRSMFTDAEANGPQWASANDRRVTPLGRFMRKTRLDELPQLWNVIRGEMGFFGPRPERPEIYRELKKEIPLFSLRTVVRPGITGWAQVYAGYAASIAESQTKLEYDLFYIQNMSPRLDIIILLKTLQVALFGERMPKRPVAVEDPVAVKTS